MNVIFLERGWGDNKHVFYLKSILWKLTKLWSVIINLIVNIACFIHPSQNKSHTKYIPFQIPLHESIPSYQSRYYNVPTSNNVICSVMSWDVNIVFVCCAQAADCPDNVDCVFFQCAYTALVHLASHFSMGQL